MGSLDDRSTALGGATRPADSRETGGIQYTAMHSQLHNMTSGECRWIARHDIHVYCWAPCDLVPMPNGRTGWQRRPKRYKVFTFDTPGSPWDAGGWLTAADASRKIDTILAQEETHAA